MAHDAAPDASSSPSRLRGEHPPFKWCPRCGATGTIPVENPILVQMQRVGCYSGETTGRREVCDDCDTERWSCPACAATQDGSETDPQKLPEQPRPAVRPRNVHRTYRRTSERRWPNVELANVDGDAKDRQIVTSHGRSCLAWLERSHRPRTRSAICSCYGKTGTGKTYHRRDADPRVVSGPRRRNCCRIRCTGQIHSRVGFVARYAKIRDVATERPGHRRLRSERARADVPILVLDDLGARRPTPYARDVLMIHHREEATTASTRPSTPRISHPTDVSAYFGGDPRITSRLGGSCRSVLLGGPDRRRTPYPA